MRAIWKGAVSFGLVNVPVRVYAATGTKDVSFHQVHAADGGRIRYQRTCSVDGEPVAYGDIAKGYETDDGDLVVLSDADLASLPLSTGREIEVVEFVPEAQVDPLLYDKAYYLEPDRTAAKPYALLREALVRTERVAVVKVALRQRETLAVLRVRGDVICLQTVLWPDEVREPEFEVLGADVALKPAELTMAASLVESLAADFDPTQYADGYREAVRALVEEKIASGDVRRAPAVADAPEGDGDGEVVDLLAALRRSVERAKARRGEAPAQEGTQDAQEPEPVPTRSTTRKRGAPTKKKTTKSA
ncbi:non-homologous end joining protein Ku [Quadrisphaera oryzae]|uniref:non-homologous end joining protein Ku n=1 Tax=Quadrisphaera TaxID=317661 RepID=UPI0016458154|nr:Ku protein [Quadrisphaera sp. RL12-1S]MBC3764040.1 Ku protein [Quadrisphaera sp. RL12-1S]